MGILQLEKPTQKNYEDQSRMDVQSHLGESGQSQHNSDQRAEMNVEIRQMWARCS